MDQALYAITIAAQMEGGEQATSKLDRLAARLDAGGKSAEFFQVAQEQLSAKLAAATAVSSAAGNALKESQLRYRELETAAVKAAESVAKLEGSIDKQASAVAKSQEKLAALKAEEQEAAAEAARLAAALAVATAKGEIPEGVAEAAGLAARRYQDLHKQSQQLANALSRSSKKLEESRENLNEVRAAADHAQSELDAYAATHGKLEAEAEAASKAEEKLAKDLANVGKLSAHVDKSLAGQAERLGKLQGGLSAIGGPLGQLGATATAPVKVFSELSAAFGRTRAMALVAAVGIAAVSAAILALSVAAVAGAAKLGAWGVELAGVARETELSRQAAEALTPRLAGLRDAIFEIESGTGVAEKRLRALEGALTDAKVPVDQMVPALRAAAVAEAALGEGGADQFIDRMKQGKLSVRAFADEIDGKFSGIVEKRMLGFEAQSARLKSNLGRTFGGLNIEPVLLGLSKLGDLFDADTASGKAMKLLFEAIFQPFINGAEKAATVLEAFVLGVEIGLVKLYIAAKPAIKWLGELIGIDDTSLPDVLTLAKNAGEALAKVAVVVGGVLLGVGTAIGAVVGAAVTLSALWGTVLVAAGAALIAAGYRVGQFFLEDIPRAIDATIEWFERLPETALVAGLGMLEGFGTAVDAVIETVVGFVADVGEKITGADWLGLGASIVGGLGGGFTGAIGGFMGSVTGLVTDAWDRLASPADWIATGKRMIDGLIQGIAGGAGRVAGAIGDVAQGAINRAKSVLGIASPSKVMEGIGDDTAEGLVVGTRDRTADVQDAMAEMVAPPEVSPIDVPAPRFDASRIAERLAPSNDNALPAEVSQSLMATAERAADPARAVADYAALSGAPVPVAASPVAQSSAGSGPRVSIGRVVIPVSGAGDPAAVAREIERVLTELVEVDAATLTGASAGDVDEADLAGAA